jgi:hypothetical protein
MEVRTPGNVFDYYTLCSLGKAKEIEGRGPFLTEATIIWQGANRFRNGKKASGRFCLPPALNLDYLNDLVNGRRTAVLVCLRPYQTEPH